MNRLPAQYPAMAARAHDVVVSPPACRPGIRETGYRAGIAAFAATLAYVAAQMAQVAGALRPPLDGILIYAASLCIVVPFVLEMLALHHLTVGEARFWTNAAVIFTTIYAVFVTANYVVQLGTVIPATLRGTDESIRLLVQTPHSMFWDYDGIGYIAMGFVTLCAIPALSRTGIERWVRLAFIANVLVTPLIAVVYFYPTFSIALLFIGLPWAVTAPMSMLLLAIALRRRSAPSRVSFEPAEHGAS